MRLLFDRCVEPAAENRYQSCSDLLYDLEHPELITRGFKKKQKRKLLSFIVSAGLCIFMAIAGVILNISATAVNNQDYDANIGSSDPTKYFAAVDIYPERVDAYNMLIEYYKNYDGENNDITKVGNTIEANADSLDLTDPEIADMHYDMGKLYFSDYEGSFKSRAVNAKNFFEKAASNDAASFEKKEIAECYDSICNFMTNQSTTSEHSLDDYTAIFEEIEAAMQTVDKATDNEANYDKISLYYVAMLLINDQAEYMAGVGFERQTALELMANLKDKADGITSTLSYVNDLKDKIGSSYDSFVSNINAKYDEVEKRKQGGN